MVFIKKLVMHGFKSFANKTEIPFDKGINVILGPNGSGKSNISDALCFVLGRLSSKSLRASKASHLLFHGNKEKKPAHEASVEIVFDNSDKGLKVDAKEIVIERVVRRKGSSVYKINNEVKTRQEVLELLASGGIDPNGFNLVLQGEIAYLVKMRPEERRVILEE
ncbi:chromosome segregation protein SMC, partial [Candidatus Pacearchaeota archaeon CG_4_10_14_0_2_um_filter_05_32_18]